MTAPNVPRVGSAEFERNARYAVGRALLEKFSKSGSGSSGRGIDEGRAEKLAERGMTGEELMELLMAVAMRASKHAQDESSMLQWSIIQEAERIAVASDSLALYKFIQARKKPENS